MSEFFASEDTRQENPFRQAWLVQGRVLKALILRELQTRYGRNNIGYLWAIVEPLILLSLFVTLFIYMGKHSNGTMDLVAFLATGIITFIALRTMASSLSGAAYASRSLLLYPQVTPLDAIIARWIVHGATMFGVFCIIIGGSCFLGFSPPPHDFLGVIVALLVMGLMGLSLGLIQYALITLVPVMEHVTTPVWRLLFFTSCVFYTMDSLPYAFQQIIYYNPIAHCIELLRHAYFYGFKSPVTDYYYVAAWIGACLFFGLLVERLYRYKSVSE